ncbi:MAG: arylesterase [Leptospiraceae bacterium]|nr:MAG: arylesterase [Leptospiraceae bacterium]GIX43584.1 MAG: arylesterase [Leptospiraceae bacterium]
MSKQYILFLGDSLTYGYLVSSNHSFPSLIEKELRKKHLIDEKTKIINAGNPGDTTEMALYRLEYILKNYRNIYLTIVFLGANDYLLGESSEEIYMNFKKIIESLKSYNPEMKIILIEFLPFDDIRLREFRNIYEKLKTEYPEIIFVPDVMGNIIKNPELVLDDGIHPNEKGYKIIAEKIYPYVENVLK